MNTVSIDDRVSAVRNWIAENNTDKPVGETGFLWWRQPTYTLQQLQAHNTVNNGWGLDHLTRKIYCLTPLFSEVFPHPGLGGKSTIGSSIKKRLGGHKDMHDDILFHAAGAQRLMSELCIGQLAPGEPLPRVQDVPSMRELGANAL